MIFSSVTSIKNGNDKAFFDELIDIYCRLVEVFCEKNSLSIPMEQDNDVITNEFVNIGVDSTTTINIGGNLKSFVIKFRESRKKREDSPEETNFYDIMIDGEPALLDYHNNDLVEFVIKDNCAHINKFELWQKYVFEEKE